MKFTKKKQKWIAERKAPRATGKPLKPNVMVERRYRAELLKLSDAMAKDYEREIRKLYKSEGIALDSNFGSRARIALNQLGEKWESIFKRQSKEIATRLASRADRAATANLNASLSELAGGLTIKAPKMPAALEDKITASIAENVSLIKSIGTRFHEDMQGAVFRSVTQGGEGALDIYKQALKTIGEKRINIHKRAKLIAELETAKISSAMQEERMKSVGVAKFKWVHSGGGAEPRKLHQEYNGKIFSMDDLPIIDERTKQRGMPGTIWNCRCFAVPVIEFGEGEQPAP